MFFNVKNRQICEQQFEAIFRISGVWRVGRWNLITSVRLIKVSFKVNKGNKFGDFGYCRLIRCPLAGFTVFKCIHFS